MSAAPTTWCIRVIDFEDQTEEGWWNPDGDEVDSWPIVDHPSRARRYPTRTAAWHAVADVEDYTDIHPFAGIVEVAR